MESYYSTNDGNEKERMTLAALQPNRLLVIHNYLSPKVTAVGHEASTYKPTTKEAVIFYHSENKSVGGN